MSVSQSRLAPAQPLILLGFGIDTVLQQYFVPEEKLRRILAVLTDILDRPRTARVAVAELQSVIGKLQALLLAVPSVGTFLVAAHRVLSAADRAVVLPSEVLHDFRDLLLLRRWTKLSKWRLELHTALRMETDASGHGWGAILYGGGSPLTAAGLFNQDEALLNILVKEALAVTKAITSPGFTDRLVNRVLDLYTDNEIVRFTLLKGSTNYAIMRKIARELLKWQLDNNAHIRIHRVTTSDNVVTDSLSRSGTADPLHEGHSEFRLTNDKFDTLSSWFGHRLTIVTDQPQAAAVHLQPEGARAASGGQHRLPLAVRRPRGVRVLLPAVGTCGVASPSATPEASWCCRTTRPSRGTGRSRPRRCPSGRWPSVGTRTPCSPWGRRAGTRSPSSTPSWPWSSTSGRTRPSNRTP